MTPQEQREHNARASVTTARMAILDHYEAHNSTKGMTQKAIAAATGLTCHAVAEWRCKQRRDRNFAPKAEVVHEVAEPSKLITIIGNRLFCCYREIMQLSSFDKKTQSIKCKCKRCKSETEWIKLDDWSDVPKIPCEKCVEVTT
jgi:hypothetical protein